MMTRTTRWTVLSSLLGTLALGTAVRADEEKISVEQLPAAVLKAAKAKFPAAKIEEASREVEDGVTTYEVSLKADGQAIDLTLNPDGAIVELEKEVAADSLPAAVKAALTAKYPDAKIKKAEEITKGEAGPVHYEVDLGTEEVVLDGQGKIIKTEKDDDDDDKK